MLHEFYITFPYVFCVINATAIQLDRQPHKITQTCSTSQACLNEWSPQYNAATQVCTDRTRILLQAKPSVPWPSGLISVLHLRSVCSYKKVLSHIPLHFLLAFYRTALLSHGGRGVAALAWSVPNLSPLCDPFYDQSRHWRIPALKACPAHSSFPGTKKQWYL